MCVNTLQFCELLTMPVLNPSVWAVWSEARLDGSAGATRSAGARRRRRLVGRDAAPQRPRVGRLCRAVRRPRYGVVRAH